MARRSCGRVFQREGRHGYYVRIRVQGRERERYGGPTRTIARKLLARVEADLAMGASLDAAVSGVFGSADSAVTFDELGARYMEAAKAWKRPSTLREDRNRMERLRKAAWAKKPNVEAVDIARWFESRRQVRKKDGTPVTGATLNRDRSLISATYTWGISMGLVAENPVKAVRRFDERGRAREAFLTPEEAAALLASCAPHLRATVLAALSTGLRRGTLCELRWKNIDLEGGCIVVEASISKGRRPQRIPLTRDLAAALRSLRAQQTVKHISGEDFVFRAERGGAWIPNDLSHQFREAVDACEAIPKEKRPLICFHSTRHSFASWLTMRDVHPRIVQEALAHSTPTLTARYSHLRPGAMDEAIGEIGNVLRRPRRAKGATRGAKANSRPSDAEDRIAVTR